MLGLGALTFFNTSELACMVIALDQDRDQHLIGDGKQTIFSSDIYRIGYEKMFVLNSERKHIASMIGSTT